MLRFASKKETLPTEAAKFKGCCACLSPEGEKKNKKKERKKENKSKNRSLKMGKKGLLAY